MNQLSCKMCGSPNIIQYGNIYICQNCGTKYTANDIQKMMIIGNVNVSGSTVNINNSGRLNNLYLIARRARDNNNWTDAERNYSMILIDDPYSWEATFYVVFSRAMACQIKDIYSAAVSMKNVQSSALGLIRTNVNPMYYSNAINEIVSRSIQIAKMLAYGAHRHYQNIGESIRNQYESEYLSRRDAAIEILLVCGEQIESNFQNISNIAYISVNVWKAGLELTSQLAPNANYLKMEFIRKIGKYDHSYARNEEIAIKEAAIQKDNYASIGCGCSIPVMLSIGFLVLSWYSNNKSSRHDFVDDLIVIFIVLCFIAAVIGLIGFIIALKDRKEDQEELQELQNQNNNSLH